MRAELLTGTFRIGLVEGAGFCVLAGTVGATAGQSLSWGLYCGAAMGVCLGGRAVSRRMASAVAARLGQARDRGMRAPAQGLF